jgi:hypothetical protein
VKEKDIIKLDKLREEKINLESFLEGNGKLSIKRETFTMFKNFGCGKHELEPTDELKNEIYWIIKHRLDCVICYIEAM